MAEDEVPYADIQTLYREIRALRAEVAMMAEDMEAIRATLCQPAVVIELPGGRIVGRMEGVRQSFDLGALPRPYSEIKITNG